MDVRQVKQLVEKAAAVGSSYELTNIQNLMAHLGNVHNKLQIIHVAGTNGKGSVCACVSQILQEAGFRTGLYTSPAVFDDEEQIKVDGVQITKQDFADRMAVVQRACVQMQNEGLAQPTAFEIETAIAFCYFYKEKCDFVVMEAGMGGAKDATNVIAHPVCSVLTSISKDHMAYLGETLAEIAAAKAGIIKPGCPCVISWQKPEVRKVIQSMAANHGSELWEAQDDLLSNYAYDGNGSCFMAAEGQLHQRISNADSMAKSRPQQSDSHGCADGRSWMIHCRLTGAWQRSNITCALTVIKLLQAQGIPISMEAVEKGFARVHLPGRFERIYAKPDIYIDGAHNEGAALSLKETVRNCFTNTKIVYIIGVLADKEYEKVLQILLPYASQVFTVTPNSPRALNGGELARKAGCYHSSVSFVPSIVQAVQRAMDAAGAEGVVLAFGSFSYLKELRQAVKMYDDR